MFAGGIDKLNMCTPLLKILVAILLVEQTNLTTGDLGNTQIFTRVS